MVERRKSEEVINFAPGPAKLPLEVGVFAFKLSVVQFSTCTQNGASLGRVR